MNTFRTLAAAAALCAALTLPQHAFAQAYSAADLGTFGGQTFAYDLNNHGQVVGWSLEGFPDGNGHRRAFFYDPGAAGMAAVGTPDWGHFMLDSFASAINDLGEIAGNTGIGFFSQRTQRVFFIDAGGTIHNNVGSPDSNPNDAWISGMTEAGRVWGRISLNGDQFVTDFLTGAHGVGTEVGGLGGGGPDLSGVVSTIDAAGAAGVSLTDLNTWVTLAGGAHITHVQDVNNAGQLLVHADNGRSYVLTAVPEPSTYALMLIGLAGVGAAARRRKR